MILLIHQIYYSEARVYLLSGVEVWGALPGNMTEEPYTRQLDYYKNNGVNARNYTKTLKKYNGSNKEWWTRYSNNDSSFLAYVVDTTGYYNVSGGSFSANWGVSPAFRIGEEK